MSFLQSHLKTDTMDKKISLLIACMLTASALFAQDFQLSFSTGPSINWLSSGESEITSGSSRAGYDFGVVADLFFDDRQRYAVTPACCSPTPA